MSLKNINIKLTLTVKTGFWGKAFFSPMPLNTVKVFLLYTKFKIVNTIKNNHFKYFTDLICLNCVNYGWENCFNYG